MTQNDPHSENGTFCVCKYTVAWGWTREPIINRSDQQYSKEPRDFEPFSAEEENNVSSNKE